MIDRVNLEESSLSPSARQRLTTVTKNELAIAAYNHAVADVSTKLKAGKLSLIDFASKDVTSNQSIVELDEDDEETKSEENDDTEPLGSVGYKFEKIFYGMDGSKNKCWYFGEVIDIKYIKKVKQHVCRYNDGDSEYLNTDDLKKLSVAAERERRSVNQKLNDCVWKITEMKKPGGRNTKNMGQLHFHPELKQAHADLADTLRSKDRLLTSKAMDRITKNLTNKPQNPGKMYAIDKNGQFVKDKVIESTSIRRFTGNIEPKCIKSLDNDTEVLDDVVHNVSRLFNARQYNMFKAVKNHKSSMMMSSHHTFNLCFTKTTKVAKGGGFRQKYQPENMDKYLERKIGKNSMAAVDIFDGFEFLFFPLNVQDWHWVLICFELESFNMQFYDSLHGDFMSTAYRHCRWAAKCIWKWVKRYYQLRHGMKVLKEGGNVEYDQKKLGTPKQTGVDCGLFVSVLPVLIHEDLPLGIFGDSDKKKKLAGVEMRRRIALWLYMGECYFEPDGGRIMESETEEKKKKLMRLKKKKSDSNKQPKKKSAD